MDVFERPIALWAIFQGNAGVGRWGCEHEYELLVQVASKVLLVGVKEITCRYYGVVPDPVAPSASEGTSGSYTSIVTAKNRAVSRLLVQSGN